MDDSRLSPQRQMMKLKFGCKTTRLMVEEDTRLRISTRIKVLKIETVDGPDIYAPSSAIAFTAVSFQLMTLPCA